MRPVVPHVFLRQLHFGQRLKRSYVVPSTRLCSTLTCLDNVDLTRWKTLSTVLAPLKSRSVISVRGSGAGKLLQGLVTNDVSSISSELQKDGVSPLFRSAMYAGFLAPSGRVLSEGHIVSSSMGGEPEFLIECDGSLGEKLVKHIKRYRLRAKVTVQLEAGLHVSSVLTTAHTDSDAFGNDIARKITSDVGERPAAVYQDARHPIMGVRVIHPADMQVADRITQAVPVEEEFYHVYRMLGNIPEGGEEVMSGEALPLESNFDELHAISYQKGCYLGQELTSRVHYTGVVRKRLVPIVAAASPTQALDLAATLRNELDPMGRVPNGPLLPNGVVEALEEAEVSCLPRFNGGEALVPATTGQPAASSRRQRSAGRITSSLGHIGMALLRLNSAGSALVAASDAPHKGPFVSAIWPPVHMPMQ